MISDHIEAVTLKEYYTKLYDLQVSAHREDYMLVHDELTKCVTEGSSYTELGINQGATLAAVMLKNPTKIRAYDISLDWYNKARSLFDKYAKENNIDHQVFNLSTLNCVIEETDLLYIDTLHNYDHLTQELIRHGKKVKKYIVFHDTEAQSGLRRAVNEYVQKNTEWAIITDCKINVGFMTIKRS